MWGKGKTFNGKLMKCLDFIEKCRSHRSVGIRKCFIVYLDILWIHSAPELRKERFKTTKFNIKNAVKTIELGNGGRNLAVKINLNFKFLDVSRS